MIDHTALLLISDFFGVTLMLPKMKKNIVEIKVGRQIFRSSVMNSQQGTIKGTVLA